MKMKHATWIAPRSAITVFRLLLISLAKISYEASYADIAYAVAVRLPTRDAFLSGTRPVGSRPPIQHDRDVWFSLLFRIPFLFVSTLVPQIDPAGSGARTPSALYPQ